MTDPVFHAIARDLAADAHKFGSVAIPLTVVIVFYLAGAKLMEIKGRQKWPALFAMLPFFWIFEGWFDSKPGQPDKTVHAMAALFGVLNMVAVYLAVILL